MMAETKNSVSQLLFTASKERNENILEHVGRLIVRALARTRTKTAFEAWLHSTIEGAAVREACTLCGQPKLQREDALSRTLSRTQLQGELAHGNDMAGVLTVPPHCVSAGS
jgi:hypothetical protein